MTENSSPVRDFAPGSSTPASVSNRIQSLDILRGIAVLLALLVSVWVFGGFTDQQQKQLLLGSKGWNYRVFGTVELLINGKMRALIALVFGAAMVLFLARETQTARQPAEDVFIKRQLWLIIFGLFNALLLLWTNDLLFALGVLGVLLFPFFRMSARGLLLSALFATLVYCGKNYWNYADNKIAHNKFTVIAALEKKFEKDSISKAQKGIIVKKDSLSWRQKQDKKAWEGILAASKIDIKKDDPNTKAMRSLSYGKIWKHVSPGVQAREADWLYKTGIWDLASMILLGMFLYKIRFFGNGFSRNHYLLIGVAGIATGLLLGWFRLHYQQISLHDYTKYLTNYGIPFNLFFPVERGAMAVGYASITMALLSIKPLGKIWVAFEAVGKLALTNYLVQTIVCTIFFYGYGMGYFGRLTQFQLYFFVAEIIMAQVIFSVIWLRYFNYGPAEWLLRRLSSGKWLPKSFRKPSKTEPVIPVLS
jgi:uncharacterized protein